jgi:hypothetical protein
MRMSYRSMAGCLLLASFGCGSPNEIAVTGTVTMDDLPLANAVVTFYPEGQTQGLGGTGRTGADGKYTITPARRGKGLDPGEYRVVISRPLRRDGSPADPNVPPIESDARQTLSPVYSQRETSVLKATVSKDQTVHDFPLKSTTTK